MLYCYQQRNGSITDKLRVNPKVDFMMLNLSFKIYMNFLKNGKYQLAKLGLEDNIKLFHFYIYASSLTSTDIRKLSSIREDLLKDCQYLLTKGCPIRSNLILDLKLFRFWCIISVIKNYIKSLLVSKWHIILTKKISQSMCWCWRRN